MEILLSLAAIAALLVGNEVWFKKRKRSQEHPRKSIHIVVGSFIAFWPLFMSWNTIRLISLVFLIAVVISKTLNLFASIHEVERFTLGEVGFAVAVGLVSFITTNKGIYAVSILQMALADGLAAVVGLRFGKSNRYHVLSAHTKSVVGTTTFFVCSLMIVAVARAAFFIHVPWSTLIGASVAATIIENLSVYGLDNLLVPVAYALILVFI
jgi:phytol kinase